MLSIDAQEQSDCLIMKSNSNNANDSIMKDDNNHDISNKLYKSLSSVFREGAVHHDTNHGSNYKDTVDRAKGTLLNTYKCSSSTPYCSECNGDDHPSSIILETRENVSPQSTFANLDEYLGSSTKSQTDRYYKNRYQFCQYNRTLNHPSLPQPSTTTTCNQEEVNERTRRRPGGYRFVITADTQFGILMDGLNMDEPDWKTEIEISRLTVKALNNTKGKERPLFVCVCGDLVDTESSFTSALAQWKKVHPEWERSEIFQQQLIDWKEVWSHLDNDIALVCCCGNHDVGNRPTSQSIQTWTNAFGDDYIAFWANGTYHMALNNCLFYDPTNAQDLYMKQLEWMEDRLCYARNNNATHIFVHSHFPWFLTHENETDDEMKGSSLAPEGWGPEGTQFSDYYFHIPLDRRRLAMDLFKKYNVTACFSGHFHQNLVTKSSWGMDMIVTGPLSMPLQSTVLNKDNLQHIGLRAVDVNEDGSVNHEFIPLSVTNELSLKLRQFNVQ